MFTVSKFAALLPIIASALALPSSSIESRQASCNPNFQGNPVSIFTVDPNDMANNKVFEWTAGVFNGAPITLRSQFARQSFQQGDFFIEFSGQPDNTYRFKLTADTSRELLATVSSSNQFVMANTIEGDKSQIFALQCRQCTDNARALGCKVSHPSSGQCVTFNFATGTLDGQRLVLGSCANAETYNVIPQLSAADAANINVADFL